MYLCCYNIVGSTVMRGFLPPSPGICPRARKRRQFPLSGLLCPMPHACMYSKRVAILVAVHVQEHKLTFRQECKVFLELIERRILRTVIHIYHKLLCSKQLLFVVVLKQTLSAFLQKIALRAASGASPLRLINHVHKAISHPRAQRAGLVRGGGW